MNVRTLIQVLLNTNLDSNVVLLVKGKPIPLNSALHGNRSGNVYLGHGLLVADADRVDDIEEETVPHPSLGQLIAGATAKAKLAAINAIIEAQDRKAHALMSGRKRPAKKAKRKRR